MGRKARWGVILLVARTVLLQLLTLGGTVMLARTLEPADFGIFGIIQFALAFFAYFGDAGLGGALVQKRGEPSQRELSSIFFMQMILALVPVTLVWTLGGPLLRSIWPSLPAGSEWLYRILAFTLVLTSVRVIPSILMERKLQFGRLSVLEVVVSGSFYVVAAAAAIVLAPKGMGVWALFLGVLAQGVLGAVLSFAMHWWTPSLVMDWTLLKPLLRFGFAYQFKSFASFVNSAAGPIYAGRALGPAPLGYINWAQQTGWFPLRLVEIMSRVTFPLYSRMQDDPRMLAETMGRSLQVCAYGTYFFTGLIMGLARPIVRIVFTEKWMPALPLLYVYALSFTIAFISPIIGSALDAKGKPGLFARLIIAWTAINWVAILIATPRWGMIGFALGFTVHVVVGNIFAIIIGLKMFPGIRFARRFYSSIVGGGAVWALAHAMNAWVSGWPSLVVATIACLAAFAAVQLIIDRRGVKDAMMLVPRKSASPAPST